MSNTAKIIVGLLIVALLVFGFVHPELQKKAEQKTETSGAKVRNALEKADVLVEDVMIASGAEAARAFNATDANIPKDEKIAIVMFKMPRKKYEEEDSLSEYVKIINVTLQSDPSIQGVMAFDTRLSSFLGSAQIVYVNRSHAESLLKQNLSGEEFINHAVVIEYSVRLTAEESEKLIADALLEKTSAQVRGVRVLNGSYVKSLFNMSTSAIMDESKVAFITFAFRKNETTQEKLKDYVDIIYTSFSSDASIDVVMVSNIDTALATKKATLVYANRSMTFGIGPTTATSEEILQRFEYHEYALE